MCGFCGIININGQPVQANLLGQMTDLLKHRGPDDEGYLLINENTAQVSHHCGKETVKPLRQALPPLQNSISANIGFGFRRLAIIDLSDKGHQPMSDNREDVFIVFNGEIYNYQELREQLVVEGFLFSSDTDTEVILKAYLHWGEECVHHFNGMWAFALWDNRKKQLFCSRDRFGIKPFYYYFHENTSLIVASEIKAILQIIKPSADPFSLYEFLACGQVDHTEHTFFNRIKQLRGGHQGILAEGKLHCRKYYDLPACVISDRESDIIEKFQTLFFKAVQRRLRSDVPVGCALSGGIDSSSIVAAASNLQGTEKLHTFSMVFPGTAVDESFFIQRVTERTGVVNHSLTQQPDAFIRAINDFIWHQEEPNNGSSYLAEFLLREHIRDHNIIVTLEGQGADEIISGYRPLVQYYLQDLLRKKKISAFVRETMALRTITGIRPTQIMGNIIAVVRPHLYQSLRNRQLARLSGYLRPEFVRSFFKESVSFPLQGRYSSHLNQKLYQFLFYTSIPPQLVRADKSAMAFSLECRFPFLDHTLVEMAFSLPFTFKIRNGSTKYILREAMKPFLPDEVYRRRDKLGFPTPEDHWLRNELRRWVYDTVYDREFRLMPFLDWNRFEKQFLRYMTDGGNFGPGLWSLLSIRNWQKIFNVDFCDVH